MILAGAAGAGKQVVSAVDEVAAVVVADVCSPNWSHKWVDVSVTEVSSVVVCGSSAAGPWRRCVCLISCCSWVCRSDRDASRLLQSSSSSASTSSQGCESDWAIAAKQRSITETSADSSRVSAALLCLSESATLRLHFSLLSESLEILRDSSKALASLLSLCESTETSSDLLHTSASLDDSSQSTCNVVVSLCGSFFRSVLALSIQPEKLTVNKNKP